MVPGTNDPPGPSETQKKLKKIFSAGSVWKTALVFQTISPQRATRFTADCVNCGSRPDQILFSSLIEPILHDHDRNHFVHPAFGSHLCGTQSAHRERTDCLKKQVLLPHASGVPALFGMPDVFFCRQKMTVRDKTFNLQKNKVI